MKHWPTFDPADGTSWHCGKWRGAAKLAATLCDRMDDALLFRDIATLRYDADIPQTLDEIRWRGARKPEFHALCDELGFDSIKSRPTLWAE